MKQHIPIDKFFHDQLIDGEEQLNLGAWANMERMLDGKNPYQAVPQEDNKKRKFLLPLIGFIAIIGTAITASKFFILSSPSAKKVAISNPHAVHEPIEIAQNNQLVDQATAADDHFSSQKDAIQIHSDNIEASSNTINNRVQQNQQLIQPNKNQTHYNNLNEDTNKFVYQDIAKTASDLKSNNTTQAIHTTGAGTEQNEKNQTTELPSQNRVLEKNNLTKSFDIVTLSENIHRDEHNKIVKTIDTINITKGQKTAEVWTALTPEESNPRLVKLSEIQEKAANETINLGALNSETHSQQTNAHISKTEGITLKSAAQPNNKKSSTEVYANSVFNKLKESANKIAAKRIQFYPGISLGVNAAFFNTPHNYGGFHIGLNNLIPVSNYFSILTELKLFYRNNSGYSVNDKKTFIYNYSADQNTLSASQQTIHNYQIDSTTKKYNFKTFQTIELPILIQAHIGKFSPYIGAQLSYMFALKTQEITKNYAPIYNDTLANAVTFNQPNTYNYMYNKSDFKSRFGYGYTIGTSYSFNPNLYVDLRLSNTLADNARTNPSREISNGVFKIPFVQFSIAYRFKKFTPRD